MLIGSLLAAGCSSAHGTGAPAAGAGASSATTAATSTAGAQSTAGPAAGASAAAGSGQPGKILVIMEENHSLQQIFPSGMPYLWSLAQRYAYATDWS